MGKQVKLLENHSHFLSDTVYVDLRIGDQLIIHIDLAFRHILKQIQTTQKGTFAGTGRTNHHDNLSLTDMLVNSVKYGQISKFFMQILYFDHLCSSFLRTLLAHDEFVSRVRRHKSRD